MVATDDEDVIFVVAKDTAWGITGDPEDTSKVVPRIWAKAQRKKWPPNTKKSPRG
jgi:hypothetical protein